ncbi:unnamed protein product [Polarella glacialis]|uniref:Uncharacterized protein n=1 Tax=Polarella glacialis TaxID=89957 RepID=A0A813I0I8_POLGL|nr:unnamed protein product [Polarella glacialis]
MIQGSRMSSTTVCISGTNVWHKGNLFATVKVLNPDTCVLITSSEDAKGYLSPDRSKIEWDDGDCWQRETRLRPQIPDEASLAVRPAPGAGDVADSALGALLRRDAKALHDLFLDGSTADLEVDPTQVWKQMRWDPKWTGKPPQTPLVVAAILLQWPEGVEVCVRKGANVNGTYSGPFRHADGSVAREAAGAPILRVALTAQGPSQCTICQHVLSGKVRGRTFQTVRRKAKAHMDFVTAGFFDNFQGPFLET